jgi:hypothetical protein
MPHVFAPATQDDQRLFLISVGLKEGRVMDIVPKNKKPCYVKSPAGHASYSSLATMNEIAKVLEGHKSGEIKCFKCMLKFDTDWAFQRHVLMLHSCASLDPSTNGPNT